MRFSASGQTYDVIFDAVGKSSISGYKRSLEKKGFYLLATFRLPMLVHTLWLSMTNSKKVMFGLVKERTEALTFLKELIEAGKIKSVIDRRYPLE